MTVGFEYGIETSSGLCLGLTEEPNGHHSMFSAIHLTVFISHYRFRSPLWTIDHTKQIIYTRILYLDPEIKS